MWNIGLLVLGGQVCTGWWGGLAREGVIARLTRSLLKALVCDVSLMIGHCRCGIELQHVQKSFHGAFTAMSATPVA